MTAAEKIQAYRDSEKERLWELIKDNPIQLRIEDVAKFLNMSVDSLRSAIDNSKFGLRWRKVGKTQMSNAIFTKPFVEWYLNER